MDWKAEFETGLPYGAFLEEYAQEKDREKWREVHDKVELTAEQAGLLGAFKRQMNVLALMGAWCGDCVAEGPVMQRIAEASPMIDLRFADRDARVEFQDEVSICGGKRVPIVVFLSEDFYECGRYGDRTLTRYRRMAAQNIGPSCPLPMAPPDDVLAGVAADWLREFERIQLMLLLSPRLRKMYGD